MNSTASRAALARGSRYARASARSAPWLHARDQEPEPLHLHFSEPLRRIRDEQHGPASFARSLVALAALAALATLEHRPDLHPGYTPEIKSTRSISSSHRQTKPRRTKQPASKPAYPPDPARCHLGLNSARVITTASEPAPTRPAQLSRSRSRPRGDREDPAQQKQLRRQRRSGDHRHQRRDHLPEHIHHP